MAEQVATEQEAGLGGPLSHEPNVAVLISQRLKSSKADGAARENKV
jgi:hypothetical protein